MATNAAVMMTEHRMVTGATTARTGVAKNLLLFFAAPFIGLAYIVVFPFVGCAAIARAAVLGR